MSSSPSHRKVRGIYTTTLDSNKLGDRCSQPAVYGWNPGWPALINRDGLTARSEFEAIVISHVWWHRELAEVVDYLLRAENLVRH